MSENQLYDCDYQMQEEEQDWLAEQQEAREQALEGDPVQGDDYVPEVNDYDPNDFPTSPDNL